jgi:hypothetical protein
MYAHMNAIDLDANGSENLDDTAEQDWEDLHAPTTPTSTTATVSADEATRLADEHTHTLTHIHM